MISVSHLISKASDCTIFQFMRCKFDNDFSVLGSGSFEELAQAFDNIYTEYIDLCGAYIPELEIMKGIKALECRLQAVHLYLEVCRQAIELPQTEEIIQVINRAIDNLKKKGYSPSYTNKEDFLKQLKRIESRESQYKVELDRKNKELSDYRKKNTRNIENNSRTDFIRLLNELGKVGYKIDKEKTTVEELALMVKAQSELVEAQKKNLN